jgi:uncharacterized protein (DUF1800 family)
MKRRTFLETGTLAALAGTLGAPTLSAGQPERPARSKVSKGGLHSAGDLTPYSPRPDKPWDITRAAHLLRRAGYGGSFSAVAAAVAASPQAVVDALLSPPPMPGAPAAWTSQAPFPQLTNQAVMQYSIWVRDLQEWWLAQMVSPAAMLREKMVLFWHNHFVSEFLTVYVTQYLYIQNQLFREHAFGDVRELTKRVAVDPAMLIYLDGNENKAGNPNENFARELLELFTLGVGADSSGRPYYTEADIIELARALTGWRVNELVSEFRPARFDTGTKRIFGTEAPFGLTDGTTNVIDHIFEQVDADFSRRRAAIFLCTKLYRHFVAAEPDMAIVAAMAQTLESSNWNIAPVLRELLTSEHFFDDNVVGALIKSPADYVCGALSSFSMAPAMMRNNVDVARPQTHDPLIAMAYLAQRLFYPPNVKGWIGGREWISSATLPLRIRYAKFWIEPITGSLPYGFDPVAFVKTLSRPNDVNAVVDDMIALLLPVALSARERDNLKSALTGGGPDYEWSVDATNASTRIRACLIRLTSLAEFQLM